MRHWVIGVSELLWIGAVAMAQGPIPIGGEFQVNTYSTGGQEDPRLTFDALGNCVVVWQSGGSSGTDNSLLRVQAQRYLLPIFWDGLEIGNTSAWSNTVD